MGDLLRARGEGEFFIERCLKSDRCIILKLKKPWNLALFEGFAFAEVFLSFHGFAQHFPLNFYSKNTLYDSVRS